MKVLHVTPAFFPATYWGGPISSLHGLCNSLSRLPGMELRVLTTDASGPMVSQRLQISSYPCRYPAGYDVWFTRQYLTPSFAPRMLAELPRLVRWADVVHLTAVYSPPTLPTLALCLAMKRPLIWSPRGSLQRWSGTRNRTAKRAWEWAARRLVNSNRTRMHCTSEEEAEASRDRMANIPAFVVPNGVDKSPYSPREVRDKSAPLKVLYVGRIDLIKALDNLIEAVSLAPRGSVVLTIAGSGDGNLVQQLETDCERLGISQYVRFAGHVEGSEKEDLFRTHDVLTLVSHSENFGMVVVEALSRGLAVIAGHGTPWKRVEQKGCGLWIANDPLSIATAFDELKSSDLVAMGAAGKAWAESEFSWDSLAQRMVEEYRAAAEPAEERA